MTTVILVMDRKATEMKGNRCKGKNRTKREGKRRRKNAYTCVFICLFIPCHTIPKKYSVFTGVLKK